LGRKSFGGKDKKKKEKLMQVRLMQDLDDFNELFLGGGAAKVFGNN